MTRAERYTQVKALRDQGMLLREISEAVGLAKQTVSELLLDPDGEKVRARKDRYRTPCVDCGTLTNPNGRRAVERCLPCTREFEKRASQRWILDSFREWHEMFGAPPSAVDWSPAQARSKPGMAWKAERTERTGRPWPSSTLVQSHFGSWNGGVRAAGFEPMEPVDYPLGRHGQALRDEEMAA